MGCESTTMPGQVPANLTQECDKPVFLPKNATVGDLLSVSVKNAHIYQDCKERHASLASWVKKID